MIKAILALIGSVLFIHGPYFYFTDDIVQSHLGVEPIFKGTLVILYLICLFYIVSSILIKHKTFSSPVKIVGYKTPPPVLMVLLISIAFMSSLYFEYNASALFIYLFIFIVMFYPTGPSKKWILLLIFISFTYFVMVLNEQFIPYLSFCLLFYVLLWKGNSQNKNMGVSGGILTIVLVSALFILYVQMYDVEKVGVRFYEQLAPATWNRETFFSFNTLFSPILEGTPEHRKPLILDDRWAPQFRVSYFIFADHINLQLLSFLSLVVIGIAFMSYLFTHFIESRMFFSSVFSLSLLSLLLTLLSEVYLEYGRLLPIYFILSIAEIFMIYRTQSSVSLRRA